MPARGGGSRGCYAAGDPGRGHGHAAGSDAGTDRQDPGLTPLATDDVDHDGIPDAWERYYFGSLPAVNRTTDRDNDGSKDWKEWVAGTSPTNRLDLFRTTTCSAGPVNPLLGVPSTVLEWQSVTGRTYTLCYAAELLDQTSVWTLFDQMAGTGGMIRYTNAWPDPVGFYSLG